MKTPRGMEWVHVRRKLEVPLASALGGGQVTDSCSGTGSFP